MADKATEKAESTGSGERKVYSKLLVVGAVNSGKTSLLQSLSGIPFNNAPAATVGFEFYPVQIHKVWLQLWDSSGQESFGSLTRQMVRKMNLILLAYDSNDAGSFQKSYELLKSVIDDLEPERLVVVGCKNDLPRASQTMQVPQRWFHVLCSAKKQELLGLSSLIVAQLKSLESLQPTELHLASPTLRFQNTRNCC